MVMSVPPSGVFISLSIYISLHTFKSFTISMSRMNTTKWHVTLLICYYKIISLHVEVGVHGILFNELAAGFNFFTHASTENSVCGNCVRNRNAHHLSAGRIHCRLPKLGSVHFTKTLVPLNTQF